MKSYKLEGLIRLLTPLSHIGDQHGPDAYLSESLIIGEDGEPTECFVYSGNSFRGILRDAGTKYLLERLGRPQVPLSTFYTLFSGGVITGEQALDIDHARTMRKVLPLLSVFGAAVGSQVLPGKWNSGELYPICRETMHILPPRLRRENAKSWRHYTYEKSFTRVDDAKDDRLRQYLQETPQLPKGMEQVALLPGDDEEASGKEKKKAREHKQQMRYTVEVMAAGTEFYQRIVLEDVNELELGAFVSALAEWSKAPYLGGMNRIGLGLVEARYDYVELGKGDPPQLFTTISEHGFITGPLAAEAKERYDGFLLELYQRYIEDRAPEIKALLAGEKR